MEIAPGDVNDREATRDCGGAALASDVRGSAIGANMMVCVLALGLSVILSATANAATVHRVKPTRQHVIVAPSQGVTAPGGFTDWRSLRPEDNRNLDPSNRGG